MTVCLFQSHQSSIRHCERRCISEAIYTPANCGARMDCHASIKPFEARNDVVCKEIAGQARNDGFFKG